MKNATHRSFPICLRLQQIAQSKLIEHFINKRKSAECIQSSITIQPNQHSFYNFISAFIETSSFCKETGSIRAPARW